MPKIVILDDVDQIRDALAMRLQVEGHDVETASNGAEAIDLAYLYKPDLLIADWNLESDYNGLEVAEAFLAANEDAKSIIMSGHQDFIDAFTQVPSAYVGEKYGLVGSLSKPFSLQQLMRTVREALTDASQQSCS
jgi:DNA-binding NtrC family response regulator